ncbi:MAG: vitamin B12 dependent-methionine synthase activation domain-containing protein, partial [Pseudomonadota bacterium]
LQAARDNAPALDWSAYEPPAPTFTGVRAFREYDLAELAPYIDWTPFFASWELAGRYPQILDDNVVGPSARSLFKDAQEMLARIVDEKWFTAHGVVGFWPASRVGDDIAIYADETRGGEIARLHTLRQQMVKDASKPNFALADYVAAQDSGKADYVGGFAVTAGHGEDDVARDFEKRHDDYGSIMVKALADRLAEAFAERLHERVRKEFWAYAPDEDLSPEQLIAEAYRGIRPAPGYPAQPDHTEKRTLFDLLQAENHTGIELTESYAMTPGSSVSGLYFAHPESLYFGVGRIERDQTEEYAVRKGMSTAEAEKWLAPILNYEPGA